MTVIAAYTLDNNVYLFGDLLLTTDGQSTRSVELPTLTGPTSFPDHSLYGTRQKTFVISPDCALAWAGELEWGLELVEKLRFAAARGPTTYNGVMAIISEMNAEVEQLQVVGWCKEGADGGVARCFYWNTQRVRGWDGFMMVGGSAAKFFVEAIQAAVADQKRLNELTSNLDPKLHWLSLQAHWLAREALDRSHAGSLRQRFGAGYELVYLPDGGDFCKAEHCTVVAWYVDARTDIPLRALPFFACKSQYFGDCLVMRISAAAGSFDDGETFGARNQTLAIQAPYTDAPIAWPDEQATVSLNSQAVCNMFFVHFDGELVGYFGLPDIGPKGKHSSAVWFVEDGQHPRCEMSDGFRATAGEWISECLEQHRENLVSDRQGMLAPSISGKP